MPKETETRIGDTFTAENLKVRDVLKKLSDLAARRGSLTIRDIADKIEKFDDEPAEAVWESLKLQGIKITGIDVRPIKRRPDKRNGRGGDENELLPDVIDAIFQEGRDLPLLTHREEIEEFIKIRRGERASRRIYDIAMGEAENSGGRREIKKLAPVVVEGNKSKKLISDSNKGLAIKEAKKRYSQIEQSKAERGGAVEFSDLINDAKMGLLRVIRKFEWQRGLKFSTYATWWAKQATTRSADLTVRTIRIPSHHLNDLSKYHRIVAEHKQKTGKMPSDKEIIKAGFSRVKLEAVRKYKLIITSLSEPVGNDGEDYDEMGDFIPDENNRYEERMNQREMEELVDELYPYLNTREERIVRLLSQELNQNQIGTKFGLSRERIRQLKEEIDKKAEVAIGERARDLLDD